MHPLCAEIRFRSRPSACSNGCGLCGICGCDAAITDELRHAHGLCLLRLGRPGEAKQVFEEILSRNPNHAEAKASIG